MRIINLLSIFLALIVGCCLCRAVEIQLVWDPSLSPDVSYILYASTNSLSSTNLHSSQVAVDTGTNCQVTIKDMQSGIWTFTVTAYRYSTNTVQSLVLGSTNYVTKKESEPSNFVLLEIPKPPTMMRTLMIQANATLIGTNWFDAGFFRLRILP